MSNPQFTPIPELTPKEIERFWKRVNKTPGQGPHGMCWTFTGGKDRNGYGRLVIRGKYVYAHRVGHSLLNKKAPGNKCVLHWCDNPPCIRCTYAGSKLQNAIDCDSRNRRNARKGSNHPRARLSTDAIKIIRNSTACWQTLAIIYKVTKAHINRIRSGERWKCI